MDEDAPGKPSAAEQASRLYENLESQAAAAGEELVGSSGFAALLARAAENAAALTKLSGDAMDLALRNLRLAGRRDVISLSRQLARTEDKLERVLQEVEGLRAELKRASGGAGAATASQDGAPAARSGGRNSKSGGRAGQSGGPNSQSGARATRTPSRRRKEAK